MGVPTLWITHSKDRRTHGIVSGSFNLPQCIYNIENLEHSSLTGKILDIFDNRNEIKRVLKIKVPQIKELTMENGKYFQKYVLSKN